MKPRSTFGLYPKELAELLATGSGDDNAPQQLPPAEVARLLLQSRLAGLMHFDKDCVDSLSDVLDKPCPELQPIAGRTLGDVLMDPTTPLATLETLKQYGKGLSLRWEEGPEHVVAAMIYFAAIAAALVFHGRKITTRSHRDLADLLRILMNDRWITPELAGLFDSARTMCEASKL
jgi:hypothetical protein